jgi:hypothetical protein
LPGVGGVCRDQQRTGALDPQGTAVTVRFEARQLKQ